MSGSKGQDLVADQQVNDEFHSAQLDSQQVSSLIICTFSDTFIFKDQVAARNIVFPESHCGIYICQWAQGFSFLAYCCLSLGIVIRNKLQMKDAKEPTRSHIYILEILRQIHTNSYEIIWFFFFNTRHEV